MAKAGARSWLKGTALASDFGLSHRRAAECVFKWGTNVPRAHPLNLHAQRAADAIRQDTDGQFDLQLFPNNELGGDTSMFSQLQSGELECFTLSGVNVLSAVVPAAAIHGVGFAFPDYDAVWKALDGKLGRHLRAQIEKFGLVVMDRIWDNGFRQITTSTRAIVQPADLQGLNLRVPISALWISLFQSLGAAPGGIDFSEVYAALQAKIFDGQENPLAIISTARLNEVQTYCSLTNHMWDGWWVGHVASSGAICRFRPHRRSGPPGLQLSLPWPSGASAVRFPPPARPGPTGRSHEAPRSGRAAGTSC
jgi:TRAP-type transport system periplasmic protein